MSTITVKKIYNGVSYSKSYTLIVEANSIFYSVTNANHDHYSSLNTAYDAFSTNNITNIRHRSGAFSGSECKASLKCTKIFASRSHGWITTDYTITGIKLDDAAPGVGAYLFSQSTNAMTSTSAVINSRDSFEKAVPGTKEGLDSAVIVGDSSLTIADLIS